MNITDLPPHPADLCRGLPSEADALLRRVRDELASYSEISNEQYAILGAIREYFGTSNEECELEARRERWAEEEHGRLESMQADRYCAGRESREYGR